MDELSAFQRDIVTVLPADSTYGLGIKRRLGERYGEEINHGRLYPNLDSLEEDDYVRKRAIDERTNEYELTEKAERELLDHIEWRLDCFVCDGDRERDVVRALDSEA
ncbi:MAG: PadR family transcriptional regulator [Halobacteriota archaeon]